MMTNSVFVWVKELPYGMNAATLLDEDGNYNVYLNARLDFSAQRKAYEHEMVHIRRGDFYNDLPIAEAENI